MGFGNIIDSVFVEILLYCFYNGIRDFGEIVLRWEYFIDLFIWDFEIFV